MLHTMWMLLCRLAAVETLSAECKIKERLQQHLMYCAERDSIILSQQKKHSNLNYSKKGIYDSEEIKEENGFKYLYRLTIIKEII